MSDPPHAQGAAGETSDQTAAKDDEASDQTAAKDDEASVPWTRLNPRMLLVHPLRELIRYLPIIAIAAIAGAATGGGEPWWAYGLSGLGIVVGVTQYFTTTYRITGTHVEIKRGILNRKLLSAPRERIRSVDVDSTILHRIFGLSVVKVGTGASHGRNELEFNALATRDVAALRRELLSHVSAGVVGGTEGATVAHEPSAASADASTTHVVRGDGIAENPRSTVANLSHWRPSWVRFAPFTLSGVASIFVVVAFLFQIQFFDDGAVTRLPIYSTAVHQVTRVPVLETLIWGLVVLIVVASAVAMVRYALGYGKFAIGRVDESTLHISHGLLRLRQVTLDERRLRGITVSEPLSLRAVKGATAHAIMTGLGRERGGVALLSPPGPRDEAIRIATEVLGTAEPLTRDLEQHGRRARRRRYTRALLGVVVLGLIAVLLQFLGAVGPAVWWAFAGIVPASAYLAFDRYRRLGHALVDGWLVTRSGSLNQKRSVLATEGIIGWTVRRSYFQRRAGLATLIATTAAGKHKYEILDIPQAEVWPLIEAVSLRRAQPNPGEMLARYVLSV
jgi:putative membrane protein